MRATVTIEKEILDELVRETKAKSKANAVKIAIAAYMRGKKVEKIKSMRGKLSFDRTSQDVNPDE